MAHSEARPKRSAARALAAAAHILIAAAPVLAAAALRLGGGTLGGCCLRGRHEASAEHDAQVRMGHA